MWACALVWPGELFTQEMQNCNAGIGEEMWPGGEVASRFLDPCPGIAGTAVVGCSQGALGVSLRGCSRWHTGSLSRMQLLFLLASHGLVLGASPGDTAGTRG